MFCRACSAPPQHREKEVIPTGFEVSGFLSADLWSSGTPPDPSPVPLMVHKLFERWEVRSNPDAMRALAEEKLGLLSEGTWLEDNPVEKDVLVSEARASISHLHLG